MLAELKNNLRPLLSPSACLITPDNDADEWASAIIWWSDYRKKTPLAVVKPANEDDVRITVTFACRNGIPFVSKGGGHSIGFSSIDSPGIVIDLSLMRNVSVNVDTGVVTAQAGVTIKEGTYAAAAAGLVLPTGTCDTVGLVGSSLGGGLGRWFGYMGYGADSIISMRVIVVGDSGEARLVDASSTVNSDLFWALRGNGPLFGIVTEVCFQGLKWSHDIWHSTLVFEESKANTIVDELEKTHLTKEMHGRIAIFAPPPDHKPMLILQLWYIGPPNEAARKFSGFLGLPHITGHPMAFVGQIVPYTRLNEATDVICAPGGQKNVSAFVSNQLDNQAVSRAFNIFSELVTQHTDYKQSVFLLEFYSTDAAKELDKNGTNTSISSDLRQLAKYWMMPLPCSSDPKLVSIGVEYTRSIRRAFSTGPRGEEVNLAEYINMPSDDASTASIFGHGERVDKLRMLKAKWDPLGVIRGIIPLTE